MTESFFITGSLELHPVGKSGHVVRAWSGDRLNLYPKHAILFPSDGRNSVKVQRPQKDVLEELRDADNAK